MAQQAKVLKGFGKAQGPLNYAVKSINGVSYGVSELVTKYQGKVIDAVLLDTVSGGRLYDFEGAGTVYNEAYHQGRNVALVDKMFNSIVITK